MSHPSASQGGYCCLVLPPSNSSHHSHRGAGKLHASPNPHLLAMCMSHLMTPSHHHHITFPRPGSLQVSYPHPHPHPHPHPTFPRPGSLQVSQEPPFNIEVNPHESCLLSYQSIQYSRVPLFVNICIVHSYFSSSCADGTRLL